MPPWKVLMTRSLVSMMLVAAFAVGCGNKDTGDTGSSEPLIKSTSTAKSTATTTTDPTPTPTPAQSTPPAASASATPSTSASATASAAPGGHGLPGMPGLPPDAQKKAACMSACLQKNAAKGIAAASECQTECNK